MPRDVQLHHPVTVRVPATSANLGPGFDSLALALDLHDEVTVEALEPRRTPGRAGPPVEVSGEGVGAVPTGEDHLVLRSLRTGLAHAGAEQPVLRMTCRNAVPHGRGLGSSASAIVAGLVAARALLADPDLDPDLEAGPDPHSTGGAGRTGPLDEAAVLELATAAEGHPDNASAAVLGGCTVSWVCAGRPQPGGAAGPGATPGARALRLALHADLRVVACVPDGRLATSRARAMLPAHVPHADAAFTAGRAALLVEALAHRPDLLWDATDERLHQAQRAPAMPDTAALVAALRAEGAAAVVSGAGPAVLVLGMGGGPADAVRSVLARREGPDAGVGGGWRVLDLAVAQRGATVTPHPRPTPGDASPPGLQEGPRPADTPVVASATG